MVERLYLKDLIGFDEVELHFKPSLVVFTGPSGAGKSVLLGALLALFGLKSVEARISEIDLVGEFNLQEWGFEEEDITTIKALKKEKVRYFLNTQSISKKSLVTIFQNYLSYLHQRDNDFFKSAHLLQLIDQSIDEEGFHELKASYVDLFLQYKKIENELQNIEEMIRKNVELREFLEFEIAKIESVDPKEGEFEELMKIKKDLSLKEKIAEAINQAQGVFEYEGIVTQALEMLGKDASFFEEALRELQEIFYEESSRLEELDDINIESVLERIEALSALKRRYGSIEEAIRIKEEKQKELKRLENLTFEKDHLAVELQKMKQDLDQYAQKLTQMRKNWVDILQDRINEYLRVLKLPQVQIEFKHKELDLSGQDEVEVHLDKVHFDKISSGEYNRLRLAFMAALQSGGGILVLDEIDANISGEESMAVAKILKELSNRYQIFAISHQAQLASLADQHFLVTKEAGKSMVKELHGEERIKEIARIISGENITQEAMAFATKMLKENR